MRPTSSRAAAVLALAVAACQDTSTTPTTPPPDLNLLDVAVSPNPVAQGSRAVVRYILTSERGFQGSVTVRLTEGGNRRPGLTRPAPAGR